MAAANPGERTGKIQVAVVSVAGPSDRIADGRVAGDLNERRTDREIQRGSVGKSKAGRRGVIHVFFKEEAVAEERNAREANHAGRKSVSFGGDEILRTMIFANRKSRDIRAGGGKRIENISLAENVAEVQDVARAQIVIQAHSELIVAVGLFRGERNVFSPGVRQGK